MKTGIQINNYLVAVQEDFLHYIWKYHKFDSTALVTSENETLNIRNLGQHNHNAGPDFFNAQISIGKQLWAGNVEIHIKSSDWYVHNHENDSAYDNVILHVVWENDVDVFRKDNSKIPTLQLKQFVDKALLQNYKRLMQSKTWINCEADFKSVDNFLLTNWLERLYIERLEQKSKAINQLLKSTNNDWEAVLFIMLAKNFGLKVNGESFLSLAKSIDFSVLRKLQTNVTDIEALFFGQANLLENDMPTTYGNDLQKRYRFLKQKFQLNNQGVMPLQFFRLRPSNFPTLRLSQLANLYGSYQSLFSKVISAKTKEEFYSIFRVSTSKFWETHYTFSKASKASKKTVTKAFVDLLIINTIVPIKFSYETSKGKLDNSDQLKLISQLSIEKNTIVSAFQNLKPIEKTALNSQALLQLKNDYCDKNKCLQCAIGNSLIVKND